MKTLLISPLEDFLMNPKEFMPLGVLYLSDYLKKHGQEVDVLHGNISDIRREYDVYGISSSTPQYPKAKEFLHHLKGKGKVVLGGSHTNAPQCVREALEDGWDNIVVGQGEKALLDIVEGKMTKTIIHGEALSQEELDNAIPDREALNVSDYGYPLFGGKAITMITARGCPFFCSFCSVVCGKKPLFRGAEKVIEEVESLKAKGFDKFLFLDDTFSLNSPRFERMLDGLEGITYRCYSRTDTSYEPKLLEKMKKSGCREIGVGIESGSQYILDLVNKKTKVEDNLKFVQLAKATGLDVNTFIMVGLPGESQATLDATLRFMEEAKPQKFGFNIFTPMPDSPIVVNYDKLFTQGVHKGKSFRDFITLHPMPYECSVMKSKSIDECYVSTPDLSRADIYHAYQSHFEKFVEITGFDPRRRR